MSTYIRHSRIEPIAMSDESTVVAEFTPQTSRETAYQSEAQLEKKVYQTVGSTGL